MPDPDKEVINPKFTTFIKLCYYRFWDEMNEAENELNQIKGIRPGLVFNCLKIVREIGFENFIKLYRLRPIVEGLFGMVKSCYALLGRVDRRLPVKGNSQAHKHGLFIINAMQYLAYFNYLILNSKSHLLRTLYYIKVKEISVLTLYNDQIFINRLDINPIIKSSIYISGNEDLQYYSVSGNGTFLNPYVIKDKIVGYIFIENTNAFFILTNCTTFNSTYGIYLHSVINGKLINNTVKQIHRTGLVSGIHLSYCNNITVAGNIAYDNDRNIHLEYSNNNTVIYNTVYNSSYKSIDVFHSNNNIISNNFAFSNEWGIFLE